VERHCHFFDTQCIILKISKFSHDAIHNAIEHVVEDKQALTNTLTAVQSALQKPSENQKREKMYGHSDEEIFRDKVLPQIRDKLSEYDRKEMVGKCDDWKVRFDFILDYKSLNIAELKNVHTQILQQEIDTANLDLVVKYHRGVFSG